MLLLLLVLACARVALALVTLRTIREIANCTKDATAAIVGLGPAQSERQFGVGQMLVLELSNAGDDEEMEDVIAAALATVDEMVLQVLNVPLDTGVELPDPEPDCDAIKGDYHNFLGVTTRFLNTIQEKQMMYRWDGESPVFHKLAYMQALWASPKKNVQSKSFIEQQMTLYESTGCFGKTKEVLRRGVEIVEYMNDLIDTFGTFVQG